MFPPRTVDIANHPGACRGVRPIMQIDKPARAAFGKTFQGKPLLLVAFAAVVVALFAGQYTRAVADVCLSAVAVLFLASRPGWGWLRAPWTWLAFALWAWILVCTLLMGDMKAVEQAGGAIRFFLFAAALETWVLAAAPLRRGIWWAVAAMTCWIVIESWQQHLLGTNLFGHPRFADGALTGPFLRPTDGPAYLELFFPAVLPVCLGLLNRPARANQVAAFLVLSFAAATMVLIGQRMPTMLMLLGLCVSGLLFRRFRLAVAIAFLVTVAVLVALPVVSPEVFAKLVLKFSTQMEHFWATPYGLIFDRAVAMIQAHPLTGVGWDGYRDYCDRPEYLGGVSWLPVSNPADPAGCTIHPHNYWLQIGTSGGIPALILFAATVGAWLWRIRGGGAYLRNDRRAALLVSLFVMMWPIASATSLFTLPNAFAVFLTVGWGLAEARGDEESKAGALPRAPLGP